MVTKLMHFRNLFIKSNELLQELDCTENRFEIFSIIQLFKPQSPGYTDLWKTILGNHRLCTQHQLLTFLWGAVVEDCADNLLAMNHLLETSAFSLGLSSLFFPIFPLL